MAGLFSRGILPRKWCMSYNVGMKQDADSLAAKSPLEALSTPVQFVPGVRPQKVALLAKLELFTAGDLVFFFPRDYQDLSDQRAIADLEEDLLQTVRGVVTEVDAKSTGFGRSRVGVLLHDGHEYLRATWFNQPFMREKFRPGQHVLMSAKPRRSGGRWEMSHPRVTWLEGAEDEPTAKLLPL
jgi:ATP-dependent DNA helicase RecG